MKNFLYYLEFCLVKLIYFFANLLAFEQSKRFGELLGKLIFFLKIRKTLVYKQLKNVFGEQKATEFLPLVYRNLGLNVVAFLRSQKFPEKIENPQEYKKIQTELAKGRKVIVISAHFGNWELLGRISTDYFPTTFLVNKPKNPFVCAFIEKIRKKQNASFLEVKPQNFFEAIKVLEKGNVLGMLADQHSKGILVNFLGEKTSFTKTFLAIAEKTNAEIFTAFTFKNKNGENFIVIERLEKQEISEFVQRLEKMILEFPEQWFWFHNRWKENNV
ncbi:lysophospholipid acyltransferase family protein [bacterium]|nr:lysophospholipid acyltransferase family protein [bacterium]